MHLIRPEKHLECNVGVGVKGIVSIKRIDKRNGQVDLVREEKPNMLLDGYLNTKFEPLSSSSNWTRGFIGALLCWENYGMPVLQSGSSLTMARNGIMRTCFIGSSDTEVARSNTHVLTSLASVHASTSFQERSDQYTNPAWVQQTYIFPAGTGTGTVREVGIQIYERGIYGSFSQAASSPTARQLVLPAIVKEEYHELQVTWRFELYGNGEQSGTLVGANLDGGDVEWKTEMSLRQLYNLASNVGGNTQTSPIPSWIPGCLIYHLTNDNTNVRVGDSNAPLDLSDTVTDIPILGNQLDSLTPWYWNAPAYVPGTYERSYTIGFETSQANGNIGEIIKPTYSLNRSLFRTTFTPHLQKTDTHRLFITFKVKLNPLGTS